MSSKVLLPKSLAQFKILREAQKSIGYLSKMTKLAHVHQMLGVVIVVAHASEIIRVVKEISVWNLLIALLLFALWLLPERNRVEELS